MRTHVEKLIVLMMLAAGCGAAGDGSEGGQELRGGIDPTATALAAPQQSFLPFDWWSTAFAQPTWTSDNPVIFGRVNADGKDDFIGFGATNTWLGISGGTTFSNLINCGDLFTANSGWHVDRHVRLMGDINNDGLDDIVAFGDAGVWTALSNGHGFAPPRYVLANFGYNQYWRNDKHVRMLADVNGDHRQDIVAYGDGGVWIALADGAGGFAPAAFVVGDFGYNQGWRVGPHVRTTADLNGDGRADLVAIGNDGVWTALSTGAGFQAPRYVLAAFGSSAGWNDNSVYPRVLADVDADGFKDIVGIFSDGIHVARSTRDGGFTAQSLAWADTTLSGGGAVVTDLNGDHYADVVKYVAPVWSRVLGGPGGFGGKAGVLRAEVYPGSWTTADVDGNGMSDVVFFAKDWLKVARSTNVAPPPPPPPPTSVAVQLDPSFGGAVIINWTDPVANVNGYQVQLDNTQPYVETNRVFTAHWYSVPSGTHCFHVRGVNDLAVSAWSQSACLTMPGSTGGGGDGTIGTLTVWMKEDSPPVTGTPTYTGAWAPLGHTITKLRSSYNVNDTVLFIKPGHGPKDCVPGNSGTVALPPAGTLYPTDVAKITWAQPDGSVAFHACLIESVFDPNVAPTIFFNLDWK